MSDSPPRTISFDYIKGNFFRTVRSDGVWAGTNAYSDLVLNFYSERTAIPKRTVHALTSEQTLGNEIVEQRSVLEGMVREVEISISMNLAVAKSVKELLERQINAIEAAEGLMAGDNTE